MTTLEKINLRDEIAIDLADGTYNAFPKFKKRMEHIVYKIGLSIFVINSEYVLSGSEIKDLEEQGYRVPNQEVTKFTRTRRRTY